MSQRGGSSAWLWTLAVIVAGALVALLLASRPTPTEASTPEAAELETLAPIATGTYAMDVPTIEHGGTPVVRTRWWQPGLEHDYGTDPDPFVRQPLDYPSDTPRILGNRISYHVYDLELVQDMVRRGDQPGSEIAQVRGEPLTDHERQAARALLQGFFEATVPEVDDIIAGSLSRDEGYEFIGARRLELDRGLRAALGLSQKQFDSLWPHVAERNRVRAELTD